MDSESQTAGRFLKSRHWVFQNKYFTAQVYPEWLSTALNECVKSQRQCAVSNPGKVPGSCENSAGNQQGVASSGATVSHAVCEEEEGKRDADPQCRNFSSLQLNIYQNWMEKISFVSDLLKMSLKTALACTAPHSRKMITLSSVFLLHSLKQQILPEWEWVSCSECAIVFFSWEALFYDLIIVWQGFIWRRRRQFNWIFYFTGRI